MYSGAVGVGDCGEGGMAASHRLRAVGFGVLRYLGEKRGRKRELAEGFSWYMIYAVIYTGELRIVSDVLADIWIL